MRLDLSRDVIMGSNGTLSSGLRTRCAGRRQDAVPYSTVGSVKTVIRHVINKTASSHRGDSEKSHPVNKQRRPRAHSRAPNSGCLRGFRSSGWGPCAPPRAFVARHAAGSLLFILPRTATRIHLRGVVLPRLGELPCGTLRKPQRILYPEYIKLRRL
jgi:hypothetical protein